MILHACFCFCFFFNNRHHLTACQGFRSPGSHCLFCAEFACPPYAPRGLSAGSPASSHSPKLSSVARWRVGLSRCSLRRAAALDEANLDAFDGGRNPEGTPHRHGEEGLLTPPCHHPNPRFYLRKC